MISTDIEHEQFKYIIMKTKRIFAKILLVLLLSGLIIFMYAFPYTVITLISIGVFALICAIILKDND